MVKKTHRLNINSVLLCLFISVLFLPAIITATESDAKKGLLHIEGKYIEQIIFVNEEGHRITLSEPEEESTLEVGIYTTDEIKLKDDYTSWTWYLRHLKPIVIEHNKKATLKVGAPLQQKIEVRRRGRVLRLNYKLTGIAGETYVPSVRKGAPAFKVFKGEKEIFSDKFEYG